MSTHKVYSLKGPRATDGSINFNFLTALLMRLECPPHITNALGKRVLQCNEMGSVTAAQLQEDPRIILGANLMGVTAGDVENCSQAFDTYFSKAWSHPDSDVTLHNMMNAVCKALGGTSETVSVEDKGE